VKTDAAGQALSFVGTKPYGTFISDCQSTARWEEFTGTGQVDGAQTTASVETAEGTAISGYTTAACNDILYSVNTQNTNSATSYVEVKSYSFTLAKDDYKRVINIEADVGGNNRQFGHPVCTGYLLVELVKPDGSRDVLITGSKLGRPSPALNP